jgi:2-phosphosulfolactate phosphatase
MEFQIVSLETCESATGAVVVIDVLRAYSTAAYALAAGAQSIALVSTVAEALELRMRLPGALVMGEVEGLPVPGFDFSNSPASFDALDLRGKRLIQRTSAGTQGAIRSASRSASRSRNAQWLLASSFVCARATARYLRELAPESVTFVATGIRPDGHGDEDVACAEYLIALLRSERPDVAPFIRRVYDSLAGRMFADPAQPDFPLTDMEYCARVDRFDFAMPIRRSADLLLLEKESSL